MWSNVIVEGAAPIGRCKHAVALADSDLYLYGGKSGPTGLRDFWKLELHAGKWREIKAENPPPPLQEHTLIYHQEKLYLFGGQISVESETPLWIYNIKGNSWRKWGGESMAPPGRRGHIAAIYSAYMLIHGGYRDLKGSLGDIWAFHFETESWHLFYRHCPPTWYDQFPEARHSHAGITHGGFLYVHGGMCDLEEKSDFWKYDLGCRKWGQIKAKPNPGKLKFSSISKAQGFMFLYGGERDGKLIDEFWRFSFDREIWEKISFYGSKPTPRHLPAVAMLPAIIKIKNIPLAAAAADSSAYWWDNGGIATLSTSTVPANIFQAEAKPKNVNVILKKRGGSYQMIGSQTVEECGEDDSPTSPIESMSSSISTANCSQYSRLIPGKAPTSDPDAELKRSYSTSDYSSSMETIADGLVRMYETEANVKARIRHSFNNEPNAIEMESFRDEEDTRYEVTTPNYLLIVGGYDAQSRQFGRVPMSIWRLRVSHELFM